MQKLSLYVCCLILAFCGVLNACAADTPADTPANSETLILETNNGVFHINIRTLEVQGGLKDASLEVLTKPAFELDKSIVESSHHTNAVEHNWAVQSEGRSFAISARTDAETLVVEIGASQIGEFAWPQSVADNSISAYALPIFGEGKYVPTDDAKWIDFLKTHANGRELSSMSLPLWTEMRKTASLTWIIDPPYDTDMSFHEHNGVLAVGASHVFDELNIGDKYIVRLAFGDKNPVYGAKIYRKFLQENGRFVSLQQKVIRNPDVKKLAGAPHIYLWEKGPLKSTDIVKWRKFIRMFAAGHGVENSFSHEIWQTMPKDIRAEINKAMDEAKGDGEFVSGYNRQIFTRALNEALPTIVPLKAHTPLAGGHDPYAQKLWIETVRARLVSAFPNCFAEPEEWGGGLSLGLVKSLQNASLRTAWLGAENWNDVLWHPEAAQAVLDAGYLLSAYDSYGSAHSTKLKNTWDTAQMGDEIFETAGYKKPDGSRVTGFAGRGVYANPVAIKDYAHTRIRAVADAAQFNSYFLDVDATGENSSDFAPDRKTSRRYVEEALQHRVNFPFQTLNLVTGSEGGVAAFAPYLHYAHGMTTTPFKWTSPDMKTNRKSKYHVGAYWPPEAPGIFFKSTYLPPEQQRAIYAPEFKLPLYQIALHDSVVTSHHWEYPSLKFIGEKERTALIQMLYMLPPLYHLSDQTLKRDLPTIRDYMAEFAPVHTSLYDQQMTDFQFLSADRKLQTTAFANGSRIVANFDSEMRELENGIKLPAMAAYITGVGEARIVLGIAIEK